MSADELNWYCRQVIVSSIVYYSLDIAFMRDAEYDSKCRQIADNWDSIDRDYQFALGSPEQISASGMHVLVSSAAEEGTRYWLHHNGYLKGCDLIYAGTIVKTPNWVDSRNCTGYILGTPVPRKPTVISEPTASLPF